MYHFQLVFHLLMLHRATLKSLFPFCLMSFNDTFDQHFLASTVSVQGYALHYRNKVHAQNNSNNGDCVLCTRAHPRGGSVQTSPTGTPVNSRRGRQLPQLPPKGTLERSMFVFLCSSFFSPLLALAHVYLRGGIA